MRMNRKKDTIVDSSWGAEPSMWAFTPGQGYYVVKRICDIVAALMGLVFCTPLLLGCGVWIKLLDGGPVIYKQWRVGRDGWLFRLYKLRTMTQDAEEPGSARFARRGDPRILPGCGWMRRSHVDELPQLWNILKGEMSLVGPRPERPEMVEQLRRHIPRIEWRLAGTPGLTGLAQIRNGYTNDVAAARRKQAWDLRYLRHRSIAGEMKIVLGTIPKLWDQAAL